MPGLGEGPRSFVSRGVSGHLNLPTRVSHPDICAEKPTAPTSPRLIGVRGPVTLITRFLLLLPSSIMGASAF